MNYKTVKYIAGAILCFSLNGYVFADTLVENSMSFESSPVKAVERGEDFGLEDVLLELSREHPGIQKYRLEYEASLEAAGFSFSRYPDPALGILWMGSQKEIRISQPLPFPGRLSLKAKLDDLTAEQSRLRLILEKNRIGAELIDRLIEAVYLEEVLEFTIPYANKIELLSGSLRARYSVGRGNLSDINKINVRRNRYEESIRKLESLRDANQNLLGYFFNYKKRDEGYRNIHNLTKRNRIELYLSKIEKRVKEKPDYNSEFSVAVASAKTEIKKREKDGTLAEMEYLPDFEFFAAYKTNVPMSDGLFVKNENMMGLGVSMRIPLWTALSNHKNVSSKKRNEIAAIQSVENLQLREKTLFDSTRIVYEGDAERIYLYDNKLIPEARRTLESARTAYENDRVDFDALLDASDTLYLLEIEKLKLLTERDRRLLILAGIANLIFPEHIGDETGEKL